MQDENQKRLEEFLRDIERDELVVYGESSHVVKEVDLGGGDRLEIHYYEDGDEINEIYQSAREIRFPQGQ